MLKYVFIQDDPFLLPRVLDRYLAVHASTTAGVHLQAVQQGKRDTWQTAWDALGLFGLRYFVLRSSEYVGRRSLEKVYNGLLGRPDPPFGVRATARKHGVPVTEGDVNGADFRRHLADLGVELGISISGTQIYRKPLLEQLRAGIINCHGGPLPRYRGLMPTFWLLANGESEGAVTVHYVDEALDNGPIIVQKRYPIHPGDSLDAVLRRSKELSAEAILEAVARIEEGRVELTPNPAEEATYNSFPRREDARRLKSHGHRFR